MNPERPMNPTSWRARGALGAFSILVVGFFLGMMADRFVVAHEASGSGLRSVDITAMHEDVIPSFREVLDLRDDQLARIHEILMRSQSDVDSAWGELRAEIHTSIQAAHSEIEGILTPEQLVLFQEWMRRHVLTDPNGNPVFRWAH